MFYRSYIVLCICVPHVTCLYAYCVVPCASVLHHASKCMVMRAAYRTFPLLNKHHDDMGDGVLPNGDPCSGRLSPCEGWALCRCGVLLSGQKMGCLGEGGGRFDQDPYPGGSPSMKTL